MSSTTKATVSNVKWGYLCLVAVTVLFGIWNPLNKILLQDLDPLALSALIYSIAGIFLFLVRYSGINNHLMSMMDSKQEAETIFKTKDYMVIFVTAVSGSVIAPLIYLTGLNNITAVNASLLMNVEVLFTIAFGIILLKERFRKKELIGVFFIVLGTILLATNGSNLEFTASEGLGSILIVVSTFFWSLDTILSKFLSFKRDLLMISAIKCSVGGLILLTLSLLLHKNLSLPLDHIIYLIFVGVFIIGFTVVMILYSIRQIGSARTGSIFPFAALSGAIFSFIILKEPLTIMQLIYGLLMIVGVFIIYKFQQE
jgi:drug/metabolite transporter (DMT)-like permease